MTTPAVTPQRLQKLADRIHGQLTGLRVSRYGRIVRRTNELLEVLGTFQRRSELLTACICRGWMKGAVSLADRISLGLRDLPYRSSRLEQAIDAAKRPVPTVRQIFDDLRQTLCEFGGLRYSSEDDELVVTTEPIELQYTYLGPFEIRLHIAGLADMRYSGTVYRIVALDPRPAAGNQSVTHPHVSDQRLCEGEAGAAISSALQTGRICDFFQLIRAVLTTYNPSSPYVPLESWEGRSCGDCGYMVGEDDLCFCTSCEGDYCPECISYCRRCDERTCLVCLSRCDVCEDHVCPSCMTTCPECGEQLCVNCRDELLCPCLEERNDHDETDQKDNETAGSPQTAAGNAPTT